MRLLYLQRSRTAAAKVLSRTSNLGHQQAINVLDGLRLGGPPTPSRAHVVFGDLDFEDRYTWQQDGRAVWAATHHRPDGTLIGAVLLSDPASPRQDDTEASPTVVPVSRSRESLPFAGAGAPWLTLSRQTAALLAPGRVRMYGVGTVRLDGAAGPSGVWMTSEASPPLPAGGGPRPVLERRWYDGDDETADEDWLVDPDPVAHCLAAVAAAPDERHAWRHAEGLPMPSFEDGLFGGPLWDLALAVPGASYLEVTGTDRLIELVRQRWPHLAAEVRRRSRSTAPFDALDFEDELSLACAPYQSRHGATPETFGELAVWIDALAQPEKALAAAGGVPVSDFVQPGCDWLLGPLWPRIEDRLRSPADYELPPEELLG